MKNQRKYHRVSADLPAKYVGADGRKKACKVVQISSDGIRLHLKEKIRFGQTLQLEIDVPSSKKPVKAVLFLRWSKELYHEKKTGFLAGCEIKTIGDEERQILLKSGSDKAKI
jgi:hypothetical protein